MGIQFEYYAPPTSTPRPLAELSEQDINAYLQGFLPRLGMRNRAPRISPYPQQDLRLELARRRPGTERPSFSAEPPGLDDSRFAAAPPPAYSPHGVGMEVGTTPMLLPPAATPPAVVARRPAGTATVTPSSGSIPLPPPDAPPVQGAGPKPEGLPEETPPKLDAAPGQRMMEFGLALLASQQPRFGAAVGEAGQAVMQADRGRRQEGREQQRLTTEQAYREGIIRVHEAEQAWRENPNNPEAIYRLAAARAAIAGIETDHIRASAAAANAGAANREQPIPATMHEDPETGFAAFMTNRNNRIVTQVPVEAFGAQSRQSRAQAARDAQIAAFQTRLREPELGSAEYQDFRRDPDAWRERRVQAFIRSLPPLSGTNRPSDERTRIRLAD